MIFNGLGTDTGGYDFNALVQSQTLAWLAQPANKLLLLAGGVGLAVIFTMFDRKRGRGR